MTALTLEGRARARASGGAGGRSGKRDSEAPGDSSDAPMASEIRAARVAVTEGERAGPVDGCEHPGTIASAVYRGWARRRRWESGASAL